MDRACDDAEGRFVHEPRVLWSTQEIQAPLGASSALNGRVAANKDDFRNGGRWPITLTRMLVCPLGYTFREFADDSPVDLETVHNSMAVVNLLDVFVSAPFSQNFSRSDIPMASLPAAPVAEPSMRYNGANYASGIWGLTRWSFDRTLWLPRKSTIQYDIGT